MARTKTPKPKPEPKNEMIQDKPAKSLLRSWAKRMSSGQANAIPVYVGGSWSVQIPRGNKRILTVPLTDLKN